ncbi:MAG: aminotransferase class I/II-fold pyridoxal phosphate-dependent enzyme [Vicinamibacteria bacterium]|nr:aminotransferase class I/II-fold pyridoxal phosphate-dependent enzyme [Vicinamibacteria bacterium]
MSCKTQVLRSGSYSLPQPFTAGRRTLNTQIARVNAKIMMPSKPPGLFSRDQVEEKLISLFLGEAGIGRDRLDLTAPISGYGLDSVSVASVLAEAEDWTGRRIDPDLLWKQPSIRALAEHLSAPAPVESTKPAEAIGGYDALPGLLEFEARFRALDDAGLEDPFFRSFDGASGSTIVSGGRSLINFASYNYLGLADDPEVKKAAREAVDRYGASVSASRLSSGEREIHRRLESVLARFVGAEEALVFVGGHATNVSVISHLCSPRDVIVYDSLMHNSAITGARLSGARCLSFPHNDFAALDALLGIERRNHRSALVLVEGVYSTEGDIPDLHELIRIKHEHKAWLMVDEAHSIGVLGRSGRGIAEHFSIPASEIDILMGTLSKSLASCGGYVAGARRLIRYLRYTCPGFIFSAGISPANAAAALRAIQMLQAEPARVGTLRRNAEYLARKARASGLDVGRSAHSGVVPVIVGGDLDAMRLSNELFAAGVNVQPLVSPAVEPGTARLRFFVSSLHTEDHLDHAIRLTADRVLGGSALCR